MLSLLLFIICLFMRSFAHRCTFNLKIAEEMNETASTSMKLLIIGLKCDSNISIEGLANQGFQPKVIIFERREKEFNEHVVDTIFVSKSENLEERSCNNSQGIDPNKIFKSTLLKSKCYYSAENGQQQQRNSPSCPDSHNSYWATKLPVTNKTDFIEIVVHNNNIGAKVPSKRMTKHFKSFLELQKIGDNELKLPSDIFKRNTSSYFTVKKNIDGDWFILLSRNYVMISDTEFDDFKLFDINLDSLEDQTVVCHDGQKYIFDLVSYGEGLLISSRYGIVTIPAGQVILRKCISSLSILKSSDATQIIVAIGKSRRELSYANISSNNFRSVNLSQLISVSNDRDYLILDTAIVNGIDYMLLLLKDITSEMLDGKHSFRVANITMKNETLSFSFKSESVILGDVFAITMPNPLDVFLWGKNIFCSLDGGVTFSRIRFDSSAVVNFWSDNKGRFVFETNASNLWYGFCGSRLAQKLSVDPLLSSFTHLTYVFNTDDEFVHLLHHRNNSSICLTLSKLGLVFDFPKGLTKQIDQTTPGYRSYYNTSLRSNDKKDSSRNVGCCMFEQIRINSKLFIEYTRILLKHHFQRGRGPVNQAYDSSSIIHEDDNWSPPLEMKEKFSNIQDINIKLREISLAFRECYSMNVDLEIRQKNGFMLNYWSHRDLKLISYMSSREYANITMGKYINYLDGIISFVITICDKGYFTNKVTPGNSFMNTWINFQVLPASLDFVAEKKLQTVAVTLRHCCPYRKTMKIDYVKSHKKNNHSTANHCKTALQNYCFLYEKEFVPVFYTEDEVTGVNQTYQGLYNLTIIAGGKTESNMSSYSDSEVERYNFERGSSQIWSRLKLELTKHQWLCSWNSPCSYVSPEGFGKSAYYFFKVRFSNSNDTNSNCDYSFNFTIKLIGIPPASLQHALPIILVTMLLSVGGFTLIFALEKKYRKSLFSIKYSLTNAWDNIRSLFSHPPQKVEPIELIHVHSPVQSKVEDWISANDNTNERRLTFEDNTNTSQSGPKTPPQSPPADIVNKGTSMTVSKGTSMSSIHDNKNL